jgi:hypothetical protein
MLPWQPMAIAAPMTPRAAGGYDFLADPGQRADQAAVFWHPDEHAAVVLLTMAPDGAGGLTFAPAEWAGNVVRRDAADGTHIIVRGCGIRHQLWLAGRPSEGAAMTAILPLDATMPYRAEATMQFWQHATDGRRRSQPARLHRSGRLIAALRALDGRLAGASYRAIAESLFDGRRVAAEPWKTSPLRDTVIRLARQGISLMRGRYRSLLRPRRRD